MFYSTKTNRQMPEICVAQLEVDGKKIKYILNSKTRLFEEEKKKETADFPANPGSER